MLCQLSYGGPAGATRSPDEGTPRRPASRAAPGRVPSVAHHRYRDRPQPGRFPLEVSVAKMSFLAGFGAGYVLGARAGRERCG